MKLLMFLMIMVMMFASNRFTDFTETMYDDIFTQGDNRHANYQFAYLKNSLEESDNFCKGLTFADDDCKKELAAFFGHVQVESDELKAVQEYCADTNTCESYCSSGHEKDSVYTTRLYSHCYDERISTDYYSTLTAATTACDADDDCAAVYNIFSNNNEYYLCKSGYKRVYSASSRLYDREYNVCDAGFSYFGRGSLQVSWNYNYRYFQNYLEGVGYPYHDWMMTFPWHLTHYEMVWRAGIWFWLHQDYSGDSSDCVSMSNQFVTSHDSAGFSRTVKVINGDQECCFTENVYDGVKQCCAHRDAVAEGNATETKESVEAFCHPDAPKRRYNYYKAAYKILSGGTAITEEFTSCDGLAWENSGVYACQGRRALMDIQAKQPTGEFAIPMEESQRRLMRV